MSHVFIRHVTQIEEASPIYEWVTSHVWIRRGNLVNEEWVMSHIWISRAMSHIRICRLIHVLPITNDLPHSREYHNEWMSHVTYMNESCHVTSMNPSPHSRASHNECHDSIPRYINHVHEACHSSRESREWGMSSVTGMRPLIDTRDITRLIHVCDMTHSLVMEITWMRHDIRYSPRAEEIGLKIITTAKFSNKFSRQSP